jgi:hypothetical protein
MFPIYDPDRPFRLRKYTKFLKHWPNLPLDLDRGQWIVNVRLPSFSNFMSLEIDHKYLARFIFDN